MEVKIGELISKHQEARELTIEQQRRFDAMLTDQAALGASQMSRALQDQHQQAQEEFATKQQQWEAKLAELAQKLERSEGEKREMEKRLSDATPISRMQKEEGRKGVMDFGKSTFSCVTSCDLAIAFVKKTLQN
jgi:anti-sigma-K factor RskA